MAIKSPYDPENQKKQAQVAPPPPAAPQMPGAVPPAPIPAVQPQTAVQAQAPAAGRIDDAPGKVPAGGVKLPTAPGQIAPPPPPAPTYSGGPPPGWNQAEPGLWQGPQGQGFNFDPSKGTEAASYAVTHPLADSPTIGPGDPRYAAANPGGGMSDANALGFDALRKEYAQRLTEGTQRTDEIAAQRGVFGGSPDLLNKAQLEGGLFTDYTQGLAGLAQQERTFGLQNRGQALAEKSQADQASIQRRAQELQQQGLDSDKAFRQAQLEFEKTTQQQNYGLALSGQQNQQFWNGQNAYLQALALAGQYKVPIDPNQFLPAKGR